MKKQAKALWRILAAALLFGFTSLFITGCDSGGGGGGGGGTAPVTGVSLDKTTLTISVGDMETLKATVTPDDAISKSVTWSSSNASVARVSSSGVVTGVSAGYAIVTVTTVSGSRTATCYVIVSALTSTITSITVSPSSATVENGKTQQFSAVVNGTNNPSQTVSWSVTGGLSNYSSSINASGLLSVGTSETAASLTVTARSPLDNTKSGTATVTVILGSSGTSPILTSIDDFGKWLSNQPSYNSKRTPYNAKLNVSNISGIKDILKGVPYNYVSIDLSGSSITTIPDSAFNTGYRLLGNNTTLTGITIPNSVTSIGYRAFFSCTSLHSAILGNSVTSIGEEAFEYCTDLTSITIPNSVKIIENSAFDTCESLNSLTIGNGITNIENNAFYHCIQLTSVNIPNSVINIGNWAFGTCYRLANVTIGNSVTSIGERAFSSTSFDSVTIPNSVTSIGQYAFSNSSLTSVTFQNTIPSSGFASGAFDGDLRTKFYATDSTNGTPGTYTRSGNSTLWYKQ
jgi:hypothetical protein